jgi:hypothetical protein
MPSALLDLLDAPPAPHRLAAEVAIYKWLRKLGWPQGATRGAPPPWVTVALRYACSEAVDAPIDIERYTAATERLKWPGEDGALVLPPDTPKLLIDRLIIEYLAGALADD